MKITKLFVALALLLNVFALHAEIKTLRWTENEDKDASLDHVIAVINQKTGYTLATTDFIKVEDRNLATSHFLLLVQSVAGTPVQGTSLRVWSDRQSAEAIQVEADVDNTTPLKELAVQPGVLANLKQLKNLGSINDLALKEIAQHEDHSPAQLIKSERFWKNSELVQVVKIKARRGYHTVTVSLAKQRVLSHSYEQFPQSERSHLSLQALVYPIYEEAENAPGKVLPRILAKLNYLNPRVRRSNGTDPYLALRSQHYYYDHFDPVQGLTAEGRAQGFWSMTYVKEQAAKLRKLFPLQENSLSEGAILEGRYATVNIHPAAATHYTGLNFELKPSLQFRPDYVETLVDGVPRAEMIPTATLLGKPMLSQEEVLTRPARRLPDHDPASYINDGFDEIQVYYSINTLMESLHSMGFSDPELSTRPFNAFLYDPDISMRDNAYYTDDTINFTTYSPNAQNYARDNSTIWHELGHGIMDRLMGDSIVLADTGGLSEGMADFVASLVIADKMAGQTYPGMNDFRIINNTGFHLTNEVHDDGEAYGGSMDDLKKAAIARDGHEGLRKVADLTMETMRLARDNPALTASGWFTHMLFADSLGSSIRAKGELHDLIIGAVSGRNFSLDDNVKLADFSLKNGDQEILAGTPGSRANPVQLTLADTDTASYQLTAQLSDGDLYKFKYPVTIKVFFKSGPLQGAIHWDGEESEPKLVNVPGPGQAIPIDIKAYGKCDAINREDGSCVDYAYVQIWNNDPTETKPVAKKRFYLQIKPKTAN